MAHEGNDHGKRNNIHRSLALAHILSTQRSRSKYYVTFDVGIFELCEAGK